MTPEELITAMQEMIGGDYTVSRHPISRPEPQIDVHPEPREYDPAEKPYRSTFSVRSRDLETFTHADVIEYSARVLRDINRQRRDKKAPPVWKL